MNAGSEDAPGVSPCDENILLAAGAMPGHATKMAKRIRDRRHALGIKVAYMSRVLAISIESYRGLEWRINGEDQRQYVVAIARELSVSQEWLIYGKGPAPLIDSTLKPRKSTPKPVEWDSKKYWTEFFQKDYVIEATNLARRAHARRIALGLKPVECAIAIGIDLKVFKYLENFWKQKKLSVEQEARWESLLNVPNGWLRDLSIEAAPPIDCTPFARRLFNIGFFYIDPQ